MENFRITFENCRIVLEKLQMALENFLINFLWKNCFKKGFLPKKRYEKIFQKRSQFFLTDSKVFYGDFKIFFSDSDSSAIEYWNEHY